MLKKAKKVKEDSRSTIVSLSSNNSQFNYSEIYRQIRTSIEYSAISKDVKVINITSTQPGEGKTTTAVNLAAVFAGFYENVLLIDCDFRKPQVHKYFKLSNKEGLSNLLLQYSRTNSFTSEFYKNIKHSTFKNRLTVLSTGSSVPNPADILSSDAFKNYIEELKEKFDFIILDCPPIGAVSDAIPIGNVVDGTVFVCSAMNTTRKAAKGAVDRLVQNGCNVLGTILTQAEADSAVHYGYYYY